MLFLALRNRGHCTHCFHLHLLGQNQVMCPHRESQEMESWLSSLPHSGKLDQTHFEKCVLGMARIWCFGMLMFLSSSAYHLQSPTLSKC